MATKRGGDGPNKPPQEDRLFARLVGDSTQATAGLTSYVGLLGRSTKEGYWLLFTSLDMSVSVEIQEEDIVHSEQLPPDQSPFGSLGGTRVFVRKDAMVTTTRTVSHRHEAGGAGGDEFDLDIRLGGGGPAALMAQPCFGTQPGTTCAAECGGGGTGAGQTCFTCASCGDTCFRTCRDTCRTQCDTCPGDTCQTKCGQPTCNTCRTKCGQPTCVATCNTCQTKCGQPTCNTCQTKCNQATCNTCMTKCGQDTCQRTFCGTCPDDTCVACTHVTCFDTCGAFCG